VVKNGSTTLSNGASGLDGEQLTISLADTTTPGTRNGTIVLTGTASANSAFSGGVNTKNVSVSGVVQGLATALSISPSSVTDNVDENGSVSAHEITLTQSNLESVSVSGGNASKYQVSSSENGSYGNSASIDVSVPSFWVKLMDTSSSGTTSTNFTISGTKSSVGASNPSNVTLSCTATVNEVATAVDFFKFENDTGTTIDLVFDFSALDASEHDGIVGSIQAKFDGIKVSSVDSAASMSSPEYAYGAHLGQAIFNFDQANSFVLAWASNPSDVPVRDPVTWNLFGFITWQTNTKARYKLNYTSKSTITYNDSYDTFVQAPSGQGIRKYTINISGNASTG
jgi:hypothetical protein